MLKKVKKVKAKTPPPISPAPNTSIGLGLQNVSPVLPPDNEHTGAPTIELARAAGELAKALGATARALEEAARHSQKAGVYIGNCEFRGLDVGVNIVGG